jgi:hypothetical protein
MILVESSSMIEAFVTVFFEGHGPYLVEYGDEGFSRLRQWAEDLTENDWREIAFWMGDYPVPTEAQRQTIIDRWLDDVRRVTGGQRKP